MLKKYFGTLVLRESDNFPSYGIFNNKTAFLVYHDLEKILNKHYCSRNEIFIKLRADGKTKCSGRGILFKMFVYGAYEWFIGDDVNYKGLCLGDYLFDSVDKSISLEIETIETIE